MIFQKEIQLIKLKMEFFSFNIIILLTILLITLPINTKFKAKFHINSTKTKFEKAKQGIIEKCEFGNFLFQGECYKACPKGMIANIKKRKCDILTTPYLEFDYAYTKAFSTGSCKNLCFKKEIIGLDCSCSEDCLQNGTCCSDYHICLKIIKTPQSIKDNCFNSFQQCEHCVDTKGCAQCTASTFLREGTCLNSCMENDTLIYTNKLCIPDANCNVENCEKCEMGDYRCLRCFDGYFKFQNQCLKECPRNMKADRVSKNCIEPQLKSFAFIFPSKSTCFKNCGRYSHNLKDCSCHESCYRKGDCCFDYELYCSK